MAALRIQLQQAENRNIALAREAAARRKLHNLVQELRGNIRVFVRLKPADARAKGTPVLACEDGQRIACTAAGATNACRLFKHHVISSSCPKQKFVLLVAQ